MSKPSIIWLNFSVLTLTPLAAAIFVPLYGFTVGFDAFEWLMFALFMMMTGLSITAGYHRLWSHKTYQAHPIIRAFFAVWGACSLQNSILHWCADHRRHHRFVDNDEKDPYSAGRGFWFSHMGWVLREYESGREDFSNVKDLTRDPIVRWQHRHYLTLAVATNAGIPLLLGFIHGKLWGVFLLAGLLRIVLNHHLTFLINSLAHMWGKRPYMDENSARDNMWLAFFTYGEGFHNYHHCFQSDYRNGVRWWHFDPSKWLIKTFSWVGLTRGLRQASAAQIERRRLAIQYKNAIARLEKSGDTEQWRAYLEDRYHAFSTALNEWAKVKKQWYLAKRKAFQEKIEQMPLHMRYLELQYELKCQRRQWRLLLSQMKLGPVAGSF